MAGSEGADTFRRYLAAWNWRLYFYILLFLGLPNVYQVYRTEIIETELPNPGSLAIVSQWQFVGLVIEVFQEAMVLAIFFFLGSQIRGAAAVQRHDPQLKIKSFSSNSYRGMFPNKQILRDYAENCAILCPSTNYESSLRLEPDFSAVARCHDPACPGQGHLVQCVGSGDRASQLRMQYVGVEK